MPPGQMMTSYEARGSADMAQSAIIFVPRANVTVVESSTDATSTYVNMRVEAMWRIRKNEASLFQLPTSETIANSQTNRNLVF
jgi:hypothetical protein